MKPTSMPVLLLAGGLALVACSSGGSAASGKVWTKANEGRTGYEKAATATAKQVIDDLKATGFACSDFAEYNFAAVLTSYNAGNLPMARGAGNCFTPEDPAAPDGGGEEILVEVFSERPSAKDFVVAKAHLICRRLEKIQKKAGGGQFAGIPFVMSKDQRWVIEPDNIPTTKKIAAALNLKYQDMCDFD